MEAAPPEDDSATEPEDNASETCGASHPVLIRQKSNLNDEGDASDSDSEENQQPMRRSA